MSLVTVSMRTTVVTACPRGSRISMQLLWKCHALGRPLSQNKWIN